MKDSMERITLGDLTFRRTISREEIATQVGRVAGELNSKYKSEDRVLILGILNGSFIFLADLVRELNFQCEVAFVRLSSYEGTQSGAMKELVGLNIDIAGRKVVVVEDIVESGGTMEHIDRIMRARQVASYEVCTLLFKAEIYKKSYPIEYRAFEIPNEFVVGYGLDYDQMGRTLADIYSLDK